jgi:DnaJ-class molecular chaperone
MSETAAPYVTITEPDDGGYWAECPNCGGEGMLMEHWEEWPCHTCDGQGVVWCDDSNEYFADEDE